LHLDSHSFTYMTINSSPLLEYLPFSFLKSRITIDISILAL
jgi:hypothetical protein